MSTGLELPILNFKEQCHAETKCNQSTPAEAKYVEEVMSIKLTISGDQRFSGFIKIQTCAQM